MSTQKQEENRTNLFEEEEEETVKAEPSFTKNRSTKQKKEQPVKNKKYYMRRFWILLAAAALVFGVRTVYNGSTLFLEERTLDGYLPVEEYVLYQDGEAMENVRSLSYEGAYTGAYYDEGITTSRGVKIGDSWETFVEAYGDVRCEYIWYQPVSSKDDIYTLDTAEYPDADWMTIADFDREYVQSGKIDPGQNRINVIFSADYGGNEIYYSEEEIDAYRDRYYSAWHDLAHTFERSGQFQMYFTFVPPGVFEDLPDGGLYDMSTYQYSY